MKKDLSTISGICVAIGGCVIGTTIILYSNYKCKKEMNGIKIIESEIEACNENLDNLLKSVNLKGTEE